MSLPRADIDADTYRRAVGTLDLARFGVRIRETDLLVACAAPMPAAALSLASACRRHVEGYIRRHPGFATAMTPMPPDPSAPPVVRDMLSAAAAVGVGPMAAVAGAIAERVGRGLLAESAEVIVENGGDVFFRTQRRRVAMVLAEKSRFGALRIALEPSAHGQGLCTSSGIHGPSLSLGRADAVTVLASSAALADAAATAVANRVRGARDIAGALAFARRFDLDGVLIIAGSRLGAWGRIQVID
jgi:hypothetical protein